MAKELDEAVAAFRSRALDSGPYTLLGRRDRAEGPRGGRVVHVHGLLATAVNADGHREILGLDVTSAEDGAGWLAFLRGLTARGLTGVQLITSDAHAGLVDAIAATLPGASWQRCRTHYLPDLSHAGIAGLHPQSEGPKKVTGATTGRFSVPRRGRLSSGRPCTHHRVQAGRVTASLPVSVG
jgi:hypothetical protein